MRREAFEKSNYEEIQPNDEFVEKVQMYFWFALICKPQSRIRTK
jgi:hypothetical protein